MSIILDGLYMYNDKEVSVKVKLSAKEREVFVANEYAHLTDLKIRYVDNGKGRLCFVRCYDKCDSDDYVYIDDKKSGLISLYYDYTIVVYISSYKFLTCFKSC